MDDNSKQYSVKVALVVKAHSAQEAHQMAFQRLSDLLVKWSAESDGASLPYPAGSLLFWNVTSAQEARK